MALGAIHFDSRLKTLFVLVPALGIALWAAEEVGSEEYYIPGILLGLFLAMVFFTSIVKTVRFEAVVLAALITGYLVGNRGFAELSIVKPAYPGEIGLLVISLAMLSRFILTREKPNFTGRLAHLILVYCVLGAVRLAMDIQTYHLDALRDSAMVYYSVFFFLGREMAVRPESKALLERCLQFSFLALVPVSLVQRFAPDLLLGNQGEMSPLFQKDDLLTTFAAVAVFVLYARPKIYRWNWLRVTLILFYIAYVVDGITRASLLALVVGGTLLLVAGRKRILLYGLGALVLGVTAFAGMSLSFGDSNTASPTVMLEKFVSMVDVGGEMNYTSDYGDLKAGNNEFRRTLWQSFIEETNAVSPIFGRGFGYDFLAHYEDITGGEWGTLRSAHNYYVTLYGRMGILGSLVFLWITWEVIWGGIRAALATRAGRLPLVDLSYWCSAWAVLVASVVGVVLEGPIGASVFWVFLGMGVAGMEEATAASTSLKANALAAEEKALAEWRRFGYHGERIEAPLGSAPALDRHS